MKRYATLEAIRLALENAPGGAFQWPLKHQPVGARIPDVMLFGPPNTGKTSQIKAFPQCRYYGTANSSMPVQALGIQLPSVEDWNSTKWSNVRQGYHVGKDGYLGTMMPFLSLPRLSRAFALPEFAGSTVVLDEFTNWELTHNALCVKDAFTAPKGEPDTGAAWAQLGQDLTALRTASAANSISLIVLGHEQKAEQKAFMGKTSQALEGIKTSSYKQGAQFATLFGMRIRCIQDQGRMEFQCNPFLKNAVEVDRTGIIRGMAPANLGMVLRAGGFTLSRTHHRILPGDEGQPDQVVVVEGAALDRVVEAGIRHGYQLLRGVKTAEDVVAFYPAVDRFVRNQLEDGAKNGAFPADTALFRWIREDVRDALEIAVLYYEAESAI